MTHSQRILLARFSEDPRPARDVFRTAVDDRVIETGGDVNDKAARLKTAQQLIRDLYDAGEVTISPNDYLYALKSQTELAQSSAGGWGYDKPIGTKTTAGGMGGQGAAVPFAEATPELYGMAAFRAAHEMTFAEEPKVTPKTSATAHRQADAMVAANPELGRQYVQRAKVRPLPDALMGMFNYQLGKIDPGTKDRVGIAMRRTVEAAPRAYLPSYGHRDVEGDARVDQRPRLHDSRLGIWARRTAHPGPESEDLYLAIEKRLSAIAARLGNDQ